jgi:cobyrinic acid a,c-diamide synthase
MVELPRLALGTVQPNVSLQSALFAILWILKHVGLDVQVFSSQSRFDSLGGLAVLPGQRLRHLDSWLMTPEVSRYCLLQGGQAHDMALVVGQFGNGREQSGGSLDQLCEQLALPQLALLDVSRCDPCRLPTTPVATDGVLLVGCDHPKAIARWQTRLETLWGLPVIGGMNGRAPCTMETAARHEATDDSRPSRAAERSSERLREAAAQTLGSELARCLRIDQLLQFARGAAPLADIDPTSAPASLTSPLRVAVAYDEAFYCYFPDTMETLEAVGATLTDFSPLRSEAVPDDTDLVWLGCGHPERFAERLSRNICLQQSLRAHVLSGRRLYAEGGGLAYACETMECEAGRFSMAGVLPACAHFQRIRSRPVEVAPTAAAWLGSGRVRGYLNPCWSLTARGPVKDYSAQSECPLSLIGDRQVIGSRIHLHFASQPKLLQSLLAPVAATGPSDPR